MHWKEHNRTAREMRRNKRDAEQRVWADLIHWVISDRLRELGIDPVELRDYLAELP